MAQRQTRCRVMAASDDNLIEKAAAILHGGGLVAMPTETVYGLAADATNDKAVAGIFEAKGRPQFNPLIVHVLSSDMAAKYAEFPQIAEKLAATFWPGPLTLVLPRRENCPLSLLVSAGLDTVALRSPAHSVARNLLKTADRPLAAPSANLSGTISPTTTQHVQESLGDKVDMILDGGPCEIGVESTIVKVDGDQVVLLRSGGIARANIEAFTGSKLHCPDDNKVQSPGMLTSHYAPTAPLRLNVEEPRPNEAFLAFGPTSNNASSQLNLSETGELREAASNLFAHLRALDAKCKKLDLSGIAAAPIPDHDLGEAINDRLKRAAVQT